MSQTIAIILKIGEDNTETFEELFEQEILPLWHEFVSEGKLLAASLTPVEKGDYPRPAGFRYYILHVEMPGMIQHSAFDGTRVSSTSSRGRRSCSPRSRSCGLGRRSTKSHSRHADRSVDQRPHLTRLGK